MYVYLNIPAVARYEWHPFSLAGAPSTSSLSVLLRDSGEATLRQQWLSSR